MPSLLVYAHENGFWGGGANASMTMQRAVEFKITSVGRHFVLVFFVRIVVFSEYTVDVIGDSWRIPRLLYEAELHLKVNRCRFVAERVDHMGFDVFSDHLKLAQHKTNAVAKREHPARRTKLCSFWGMCDVFSCILLDSARFAAILKEGKELWTGLFWPPA